MTERKGYNIRQVLDDDSVRAFTKYLDTHTWFEDTVETMLRIDGLFSDEEDARDFLQDKIKLHDDLGNLELWKEAYTLALDEALLDQALKSDT